MISFKEISIGDIILLLTAIVVIWYSWETRGMRKEMVNQNENFGKQLKFQTFSDYTKRYQQIILNLPEKLIERQWLGICSSYQKKERYLQVSDNLSLPAIIGERWLEVIAELSLAGFTILYHRYYFFK